MNDTKEDFDFVKTYYEHHYDRVGKLEEQGLTLTNLVISISIVAFTFGFNDSQTFAAIAGLVLPIAIIIANLFAIIYLQNTSEWIQQHRKCSEIALELYAPSLLKIDKSVFTFQKKRLGRRRIQLLLHIVLIAIAIVPLFLYLQRIRSG